MKNLVIYIYLISIINSAFSQEYFIKGKLLDARDSSKLVGATLVLYNLPDTNKWTETSSDTTGRFLFSNVISGNYKLKILSVGYTTIIKDVNVNDRPAFVGKIMMQIDERILKEVQIEGTQIRQEIKGDTTIYNADAFKVNKDASTEDLVKKMPGITFENGTIKHQGEDVKKVTLDGREYMGEDVTMALKNLPAEMVDKIQVFDRASDQSGFSGFDDGSSQKTINVLTKNKNNKNVFGKVYAGEGGDDDRTNRYQLGAGYNYFKGITKITLQAMSNNVNLQNFSSQDVLGLTGSSGGGNKGSGMGMMGMMGGGYKGGGAAGYSGGSGINFNAGPSAGISTTHMLALNYTDVWGRKIIATTNYSFNYTDNANNSSVARNYFSKGIAAQNYSETKQAGSLNQNHRMSVRIEYYIDSMNSIIFNPTLNTQNNIAKNTTTGITSILDTTLSNTFNNFNNNNGGFTSNNTLLYRHRFEKYGRTFSGNIGANINDKTGNTGLSSFNNYYSFSDTAILLNQNGNTLTSSNNYSGSLVYTEPIGKYSMLNITYSPSFNFSQSSKKTFNYNTLSNDYSSLDSNLSNIYYNSVFTQKGGIAYRIKKLKWNLTFSVNIQNVVITGNSTYPTISKVQIPFNNVLPSATFQIKPSANTNLRISYRANTNPPSVSQMQSVIDNSNTLLLSTGNQNLKQSYSQFIMTRYNSTNPKNSRSIFAFVMGNIVTNYVANSTLIARKDTMLSGGIILRKGSQLNMPVNLNGNWQVRTMLTYSTPCKLIKSTVNFNLGASYVVLPGLISNNLNLSKTTNTNAGLTISSNISPKLDFNITYAGNFNFVINTLQTQGNSNYVYHLTTLKLNWTVWKGLVLSGEATQTIYTGLSSSFTQNYLLWTNSLAYKVGKDKLSEIKFTTFDVMKQNNSLTRNITETYIEDNQQQVLSRYYLLTFTWNFRKFEGMASTKENGIH